MNGPNPTEANRVRLLAATETNNATYDLLNMLSGNNKKLLEAAAALMLEIEMAKEQIGTPEDLERMEEDLEG